jgi:cytochrome b involved in lipid metabolism
VTAASAATHPLDAGFLAQHPLFPTPQMPPHILSNPPPHTFEMSRIDGAEIAKHNSKKSCWIVLDSKAYDVTSFLREHPGGAPIILRNAGTASMRFEICQLHTNQDRMRRKSSRNTIRWTI